MQKFWYYKKVKPMMIKKEQKEIQFENLEKANKLCFKTDTELDDMTWHDLNMNECFTKVNFNMTSPGEEVLYSWMKNPLNHQEHLQKRNDFITKLGTKMDLIKILRQGFLKVGYSKLPVLEVLEEDFYVNPWQLVLFLTLAFTNISIIIASIILKQLVLFPVILMSIIGCFIIHYRFNDKYGNQFEVLRYVIKLLHTCKKQEKLIFEISEELGLKITALNKKFSKMPKRGAILFRIEGEDVIADYVNVVFMFKEINFLLLTKVINKHRESIKEMYKIVGELDAGVSVALYRESLDYYTVPEINDLHEDIELSETYHPLIKNPVANDFIIQSSIAITGSNMSGKSTFLRTIGVNTLFAQSICTSLSKRHRGRFYRILSSISLNDDILQGKSYFLMEAEAIKRMVALKDHEYPTLILIDEIFKGTNPVERLASAMEILNDLGSSNTKTLVATHDLQILPELKDFKFYYFKETVTKETLDFDYKVHSGISSTRNAIKILEFIHYPSELITRINQKIEAMEV